LIAVEEDDVSGSLLVRQVSENAREIIGLSPKYLFSLDCFTDTLPDSQADILWQNTEYLYEPDTQINEAPQVFLLSGWGEPNSALVEDSEFPDPQNRRRWTCWCAVHRPPGNNNQHSTTTYKESSSTGSHSAIRNLIVLELELENDVLNPLYHPPQPSSTSSGSTPGQSTSSQSSGSTPGMSSSDEVKGATTDSSSGQSGSTVTISSSQGEGESTEVLPTDALSPESESPQIEFSPQQSLAGQNSLQLAADRCLFPSAEDIFESTTNYAKPILALERMRRSGRIVESNVGRIRGGEGRRGRQRGSGGGTMDIFAVLAQLNEQLNSANDLPTFLKIVVGIVKDITQFHRVLIYQFDEQWNGQVVAELVDWSQTQELYNTLHFPASDIPAQARELYAISKFL
jgi:hypothetical protein